MRRGFLLAYLASCILCLLGVLQQTNRQNGGRVQSTKNNEPVVEDIPDEQIKVYAPHNSSTSNVAICVIVYLEALYLDEWVDFHVALGFSPIYIYDNSPSFELKTMPFSGNHSWYETRKDIWDHIRLIHFPTAPVQIAAYDQCIKHDARNSTFVALIDVDEFLVLKTHDNVVHFMEHHCDFRCGQLSINWQSMGISNQTEYTPVPITKRNIYYDKDKALHGTIKVIVRPTAVRNDMHWWHSVMLKDGKRWVDTNYKTHYYHSQNWRRQSNNDKPLDKAVLYHYPFKSEEEFRFKTCVKGTSLHERGTTPMCNNMGYYTLYSGTVFDDTAWKQLTRMVPKYRMYDMGKLSVSPCDFYNNALFQYRNHCQS